MLRTAHHLKSSLVIDVREERGPVWSDGVLDAGKDAYRSPKEEQMREDARKLYKEAFEACAQALKASPEVLHQDWFRAFWARNYDALTVVSVLRNVQMDIDETRKWVDAQLRHVPTTPDFQGVRKACDALWQTCPASEACLVDCLIELLFYEPSARSSYRKDALMQLIIDEPPGLFNFTVVSAMGVITEGAQIQEKKHMRLTSLYMSSVFLFSFPVLFAYSILFPQIAKLWGFLLLKGLVPDCGNWLPLPLPPCFPSLSPVMISLLAAAAALSV